MRRLLCTLVIACLSAAPALAQGSRLVTHARLPTRVALDRMNLTLIWWHKLPTSGLRDELASFQLLPGRAGEQLLVQTQSGVAALYDAENGDVIWRVSLGGANARVVPACFNTHSIYVTRGYFLYALDRANGRHRLYTVSAASKTANAGYKLAGTPTGLPIADEAACFYPFASSIAALLMPRTGPLQPTLPVSLDISQLGAREEVKDSPMPQNIWSADAPTGQPFLMSASQIGTIDTDGTFLSLSRIDGQRRYRYKFNGNVLVPMGQHNQIAYVGGQDSTLYAFNMENGMLEWRYLADAQITRRPEATDRDVYVTADKFGMARVDRESGEMVWRNRDANRFLAANKFHVYALSRLGTFLVLDYRRGVTVAHLDMSDYRVQLSNTLNDRIYLANHDGVIICLRSPGQQRPLYNTTWTLPPEEPKRVVPDMKDGEKKDGEKKDEKMEKKLGQQSRLRLRDSSALTPSPALVARPVERRRELS